MKLIIIKETRRDTILNVTPDVVDKIKRVLSKEFPYIEIVRGNEIDILPRSYLKNSVIRIELEDKTKEAAN